MLVRGLGQGEGIRCRYGEFPGFLTLCGDKKPWKALRDALPNTYTYGNFFPGGGCREGRITS